MTARESWEEFRLYLDRELKRQSEADKVLLEKMDKNSEKIVVRFAEYDKKFEHLIRRFEEVNTKLTDLKWKIIVLAMMGGAGGSKLLEAASKLLIEK